MPPANVLVVEDDATSRQFLTRALERQGYAVTSVASVDAAQKACVERVEHFYAAVITDYRMPGQNGLIFLAWLKVKDPTLAVIFLTSVDDKEIVTELLRAGASDYLEKPVDLAKLLPAVTTATGATSKARHQAALLARQKISPEVAATPCVLVLEDDVTNREFLRRALERKGYAVTPAECVRDGQRLIAEKGNHYFAAVLTDYHMPCLNGLDFLNWLKERDDTLASILLTAEGEKEVIAKSLRAGASDYLEKPVDLQKLLPALTKAVATTHRLRQLAATESAVKTLGQAQKGLLNLEPIPLPGGRAAKVEICFHPKLEAGGDFFYHFQPTPTSLFCLLTDVSGHDLQAAYISAYFQGLVRGMLQQHASVTDIFACFNRFLIEEWNRTTGPLQLQQKKSTTSVAVASVLVDFEQKTATVLTSGSTAPIYVAASGRAQYFGTSGGSPLGWFLDNTSASSLHSISADGKICLWTDGLDDLATKLAVHPLALAYVLEVGDVAGMHVPQLVDAPDDLLVARIFLPVGDPDFACIKPLLLEEYHGGQTGEIDELVGRWRRNLQFAIPQIEDAVLHDILLASREAVLNAMTHGCAQNRESRLSFQISFQPAKSVVKVWVEDSGPGHQFDFVTHAHNAAEQILDEHRGLIFMMQLAHSLKLERNGASVLMEFNLGQK
jgi:DNA-binding response OmpR family regulator/anti-sigma regulatory factor (Ser/Thr protein kinase)